VAHTIQYFNKKLITLHLLFVTVICYTFSQKMCYTQEPFLVCKEISVFVAKKEEIYMSCV